MALKLSKNFLEVSLCTVYGQVVILTQNPDLQARLGEEQEQLYHHSEAVHRGTFGAEDRAVPRWVRFVVRVARVWF